MSMTPIDLTKDTWTKVLTNVTNSGQVFIVDLEEEPTSYRIALVPTGNPTPTLDFADGVVFDDSFSPDNTVASDYYVVALNFDGRLTVVL